MKKALLVQGYQVSAAISTDEARSIMDKGIAIDLLISDVLLPGNQNGPDFAVEFREQYPNCPIIFCFGVSREPSGCRWGPFEKYAVAGQAVPEVRTIGGYRTARIWWINRTALASASTDCV